MSSLFASVALFKRNNGVAFKSPRKETGETVTQARKTAARFWNGNITTPDVLTKIIVVHTIGPLTVISERPANGRRDQAWVEYRRYHRDAAKLPHVAACLAELGVDIDEEPPAMPETLEINGVIYRREI